ncbi:hypothetical protein CDAR_85161 [Caerostris darwini]|uniref:Uncharacterized protein n=1 Tax=Caerostris darwini TaxID=1538125 RepID=A0AAV4MZB7_9ARAC|nr:hypothetical protein CDAR_85161 [Caerostris darwini]
MDDISTFLQVTPAADWNFQLPSSRSDDEDPLALGPPKGLPEDDSVRSSIIGCFGDGGGGAIRSVESEQLESFPSRDDISTFLQVTPTDWNFQLPSLRSDDGDPLALGPPQGLPEDDSVRSSIIGRLGDGDDISTFLQVTPADWNFQLPSSRSHDDKEILLLLSGLRRDCQRIAQCGHPSSDAGEAIRSVESEQLESFPSRGFMSDRCSFCGSDRWCAEKLVSPQSGWGNMRFAELRWISNPPNPLHFAHLGLISLSQYFAQTTNQGAEARQHVITADLTPSDHNPPFPTDDISTFLQATPADWNFQLPSILRSEMMRSSSCSRDSEGIGRGGLGAVIHHRMLWGWGDD